MPCHVSFPFPYLFTIWQWEDCVLAWYPADSWSSESQSRRIRQKRSPNLTLQKCTDLMHHKTWQRIYVIQPGRVLLLSWDGVYYKFTAPQINCWVCMHSQLAASVGPSIDEVMICCLLQSVDSPDNREGQLVKVSRAKVIQVSGYIDKKCLQCMCVNHSSSK